jgi:hypothetical protein
MKNDLAHEKLSKSPKIPQITFSNLILISKKVINKNFG